MDEDNPIIIEIEVTVKKSQWATGEKDRIQRGITIEVLPEMAYNIDRVIAETASALHRRAVAAYALAQEPTEGEVLKEPMP
jgi:hypothetical protein